MCIPCFYRYFYLNLRPGLIESTYITLRLIWLPLTFCQLVLIIVNLPIKSKILTTPTNQSHMPHRGVACETDPLVYTSKISFSNCTKLCTIASKSQSMVNLQMHQILHCILQRVRGLTTLYRFVYLLTQTLSLTQMMRNQSKTQNFFLEYFIILFTIVNST